MPSEDDVTAAERNPFIETATLFTTPDMWRRELVALRQQPRFPQALRHLIAGHLHLLAEAPKARDVISDRGKYQTAIVALALHGTLDPFDPRSGLTGERLRRRCTALQLCSRGRVLSIVDGLKAAGHLEQAPASGDGRVRRMRPTAAMLAFHAARLRIQGEATAMLRPDDAALFAALDTETGLIAMASVQADALAAGQRQLTHSPILASMADTTAAVLILMELVQAAFSQLDEAGETAAPTDGVSVPLSISALSRRHGVSRKHVLKVLTMSEATGLVSRPVAGGDRVSVLPALIEEVANFAAGMMLTTTAIAAGAMAQLQGRRGLI